MFQVTPYGSKVKVKGNFYKSQLYPVGKVSDLKKLFPEGVDILGQKAERKHLSVKIKTKDGATRWVFLEPHYFGVDDSSGVPDNVNIAGKSLP